MLRNRSERKRGAPELGLFSFRLIPKPWTHSHTRRHLSEYTHVEAELAFITFDDLLAHIEEMVRLILNSRHHVLKDGCVQICSVVDRLLADPASAALIESLNPGFKAPSRPFMRLDCTYSAAHLKQLADARYRQRRHRLPEQAQHHERNTQRTCTSSSW